MANNAIQSKYKHFTPFAESGKTGHPSKNTFGSELFHKTIGKLIERVTYLGTDGGDRKSVAYHDQAG